MILLQIYNSEYIYYFFIIIKKSRQCKAKGEKRLTPYKFGDPSHRIPTNRKKEEKGKTGETKRAREV